MAPNGEAGSWCGHESNHVFVVSQGLPYSIVGTPADIVELAQFLLHDNPDECHTLGVGRPSSFNMNLSPKVPNEGQ